MRKAFFCFLFLPFLLFANGKSGLFIPAAKNASAVTLLISTPNGEASGFFLSSDGKIATLYSLVKEEEIIEVMLPDKSLHSATFIEGDPETGVALVKIAGEGGKFPFVELADSDEVEVGESALAAGYLQNRLSIAQKMIARRAGEKYLITDRGFNPGEWGGPLLNLEGCLIGMIFSNTSDLSPRGVVIPSKQIFAKNIFF